ncbi:PHOSPHOTRANSFERASES/INOSITOL OR PHOSPHATIDYLINOSITOL KINASE [Salix koriyanagi]|uniref:PHOSPHOTRANSFERASES/INOSITOL OR PHOSPHATIDYLINOSITOL KINASE n=1 Tax=Salix koriyanagi TaxID=2511006 RepID=A0A9Q0W8M0_9ROSI|nr:PHOSPHOTRANSFERASES/INOSITOL OR PHOSPHATIDYLINOSITOL KINASE [Salix koriyanagi]
MYSKDFLPMQVKSREEASQVLTQVLRVVNNVDEANSEPRRKSFQGVVDFFASELFNPNASIIVRKNVQSCLALLASRTGSEVSELLEPLYQPLLQTSYHTATQGQRLLNNRTPNFCLALRPPLLKLTQELVNFLQEALQIAEADGNVWVVKFVNPKAASEPILVNLAHTKNLSMPLPQGPARLLELLSSWFNVTPGAIIELFHLLPHAASKFLDELVTLTIDLEDAGQPLRDELAKSPQKILASAFPEFLPKSDVEMSSNSSTPPPALLGEESLVAPPN